MLEHISIFLCLTQVLALSAARRWKRTAPALVVCREPGHGEADNRLGRLYPGSCKPAARACRWQFPGVHASEGRLARRPASCFFSPLLCFGTEKGSPRIDAVSFALGHLPDPRNRRAVTRRGHSEGSRSDVLFAPSSVPA